MREDGIINRPRRRPAEPLQHHQQPNIIDALPVRDNLAFLSINPRSVAAASCSFGLSRACSRKTTFTPRQSALTLVRKRFWAFSQINLRVSSTARTSLRSISVTSTPYRPSAHSTTMSGPCPLHRRFHAASRSASGSVLPVVEWWASWHHWTTGPQWSVQSRPTHIALQTTSR
jgi:hypothetical protein